jgi:hypothetical protein
MPTSKTLMIIPEFRRIATSNYPLSTLLREGGMLAQEPFNPNDKTMFKLFRSLVLVLTIIATYTTFAEAARFERFRHFSRKGETTQTAISPETAKEQIVPLVESLREDFKKISDADFNRSRKLLTDANNALIQKLSREADQTAAKDWKETLQLEKLQETLASGTPNKEILDDVRNALYSDKEGVRWVLFDDLRTELRRYQTIERLLKEGSYDKQFVNVCDNLLKFIEKYSTNRETPYGVALGDVVIWLDDVSTIEPRAAKLANLTRLACSGVNVQLQVGSDFVGAGFSRKIDETLVIDDDILGTKVVGEGTLSATSSAALMKSARKAAIKILVDAEMETNTSGNHPPVTLKTNTTGTIRGEKQIQISADALTTVPARTKANLTSRISDVRINAGPLVKLLAKGQIEDGRSDAEYEAEQRASKRMNDRLNEQVDPKITELNEKYQTLIREPLIKTGLFPQVWNLSSTEEKIDWSILVGNKYQPSAPQPASSLARNYGLAVQVHQSALNNIASILLAGRFIDEEKTTAQLTKQFKKLPKFLERKTDDAPAKVSFGAKAPIDVLFVDNKIKVIVRLDDIQVLNNTDKAYTITVEYSVKVETKDGRDVVILEQTKAEAFPSSYKPDSKVRLSAVQTIIRSYLMKRLEALPKQIEGKPLELEGEWAGKGSLVPVFAAADNGWLTFAWDWVKK